jgi:hypothetical protein
VTRDVLRGRHADHVLQSLVVASENATATTLHVSLEQPFWPVDVPD